MDQDSLRALATLFIFIAFVGVCMHVFAKKRKRYYEEAANLPFADTEQANDEGKGLKDE